MTCIALVGAGRLAEQLKGYLELENSRLRFCFFDDELRSRSDNLTHESFHSFSDYSFDEFSECVFYVALGYKYLALKIIITRQLLALGRNVGTYVHPSSYVDPSSILHPGAFVYPMCNIDRGVSVGNSCLINNSVTISHDSRIEDGCFLSPSVTICGDVAIGEGCFLGAGVLVANGVTIGRNSTIGIGAVVSRDVPDNTSLIGNPSRIVTAGLRLR